MIRPSDDTCPPHTTCVRDAELIPMRCVRAATALEATKAPLEQSHRRALHVNLSCGPIGAETFARRRDVAGREGSSIPSTGSTTWPKMRPFVPQHISFFFPPYPSSCLLPCNSARCLASPQAARLHRGKDCVVCETRPRRLPPSDAQNQYSLRSTVSEIT